jgi:hypothetical protein
VIAFAQSLHVGILWDGSWQSYLLLPWKFFVSLQPSTFQDVLGIGMFVFFLFVRRGGNGPQRLVVLAALAVFFLDFAFVQLTPRFFLEPYLWCAVAAVPVPTSRLKAFFARALVAQGMLVAVVALYLGAPLFGGALTPAWRDRVMTVMTPGYAEAKWLDAVLPPDAVVLENLRYHTLMPRRFVVGDRYLPSSGRGGWLWPATPMGDPYPTWGNGLNWEHALAEFIRKQKVTVLVTQYPITTSLYPALTSRYGMPLAGPAQFPAAARSVFNRRHVTGLIVFGINEAGLSASQRHTSADLSTQK